jgi:hypothetical protein
MALTAPTPSNTAPNASAHHLLHDLGRPLPTEKRKQIIWSEKLGGFTGQSVRTLRNSARVTATASHDRNPYGTKTGA